MATKRVCITLTEGEWSTIDKYLSRYKKKNINGLLRSEIAKIKRQFDNCPTNVSVANGGHEKRIVLLNDASYSEIKEISDSTNKGIATTITDLILKPLLQP